MKNSLGTYNSGEHRKKKPKLKKHEAKEYCFPQVQHNLAANAIILNLNNNKNIEINLQALACRR